MWNVGVASGRRRVTGKALRIRPEELEQASGETKTETRWEGEQEDSGTPQPVLSRSFDPHSFLP